MDPVATLLGDHGQVCHCMSLCWVFVNFSKLTKAVLVARKRDPTKFKVLAKLCKFFEISDSAIQDV